MHPLVLRRVGHYFVSMSFLKVPEHRAILIAWSFVAAVAAFAGYVLGPDFWAPTLGAAIMVTPVTIIILRIKKKRLEWEAIHLVANSAQRPASDPRSET